MSTITERTIRFKENPKAGNLGLEKEFRSKIPGCYDTIQPALGQDGRWRTGIDELSYSVSRISDSELRTKKQEELKAEREALERLLNVDLSGTSKFWENYFIQINPDKPLNLDNPQDRLKYHVLMDSNAVAPSQKETFNAKYKDAKYYVSREFEEVGDKVANRMRKDEASAELIKLIKNTNKALTVARYLGLSVNENTPTANLYDILSTYLDQDKILGSVEKFLDAVSRKSEDIGLKLLIDEAIKLSVIRNNKGYFQRGNITYGKTRAEVDKFMSDPLNSGELISIREEVEMKKKFS